MIEESFFIGQPINFKNKLKIYPPKVSDILSSNFMVYNRLLTYSQEEIEDELFGYERTKKVEKVPTPFEFLLATCYNSKQVEAAAKDAFEFFCHVKISFLYDLKKIVIGDLPELVKEIKSLDDLVFLEEDEYFDFQNLIRASMGDKQVERPVPNEDIRITRMKAKSRYRDKIKAKKSDGVSLLTRLASICCMGIGITPLNIGEITYASLGILFGTYQNKEKYETDIKSMLAGAKVKPKYWIHNLEK